MRTPSEVTAEITKRLARTWPQTVARGTSRLAGVDNDAPTWPHAFALRAPAGADLEHHFGEYQKAALIWRRWHGQHAKAGAELVESTRRVHGTWQSIPTHISIPSADTAAMLAGPDWVLRLARARDRAAVIRAHFASRLDLPRVLREVDLWTEVDFNLLCAAATWFVDHDGAGLTPRQVPIAGMHAKWLNTRRHLVAELAGRERLSLAPDHPPRVHITYLDPAHRDAGKRRHDCISVGDSVSPAYKPRIVVISENKDTAVAFPPVPGGIAVEGGGFGGDTAAALEWITNAPILVYWGDIDAAGFEILDGFRGSGMPASSMLMDMATFETYERFGTSLDRRGNPIPAGIRRDLPHLVAGERAMYEALTDPSWTRHRRLEQERIPLTDALHALMDQHRNCA